jgi:hypothetical protein
MNAIDHNALEAAIRAMPQDYVCTNGHDRCEGGGFQGCPYCIAPLSAVDIAYLASREEARQLRAERDRLREALEGALQTWRLTCGNTDMPDAAEFANDFEGDCIPAIEAALSPTFDQRDYGDEMPERPRPRRDGPGLDVKALADLEGRN